MACDVDYSSKFNDYDVECDVGTCCSGLLRVIMNGTALCAANAVVNRPLVCDVKHVAIETLIFFLLIAFSY